MMLKLLTGPLGLVLTIAVLWWGLTFNSRLEERYRCTACTPWGIAGGIAGIFCWMLVWGKPLTWETVAVGAIAAVITLALFFSSRAKSGSTLQGILMTVWQLFVGLVVFGILELLEHRKKKER